MVDRDGVPDAAPAAGLPPRHYVAPSIHDEETARLFRRTWIFVGMTDDLSRDHDFLTAEVAGTSVVVRRAQGELRAFHNVCTHRFATIRAEPCGNGLLTCPYHGWTYNDDGVPVGIPGNEANFALDRAARERLRLRRFEVGVRGRFVFLRLEPGGPALDEHLGAAGALLDHASDMFPHGFDRQRVHWQANWKIGVESVLEVYHVDSVHPDTFKPFTGKSWAITVDGRHSRGVCTLSDRGRRYWEGLRAHLDLRVSDRHRDYDHTLIFPNLAIGITEGAMMSAQTYDPMAPDRCALTYRLFMAASRDPDSVRPAVRTHIEQSLRTMNARVLDEDRRVSETVQRGMAQMDRPALLGRNEARIAAFHAACKAALAADD